MDILFKAKERPIPWNQQGERKFYATKASRGKIGIRQLCEDISDNSTVTNSDTMAVLESLLTMLPKHLARGTTVDLGGFGTFWVSIHSRGEESAEKVTSASISSTRVRFRSGAVLRTFLSNLKYEKCKE